MAALVLVRLLVALPVGALAGGYLVRRLPRRCRQRGRHGAGDGRLRAGCRTWGLHPLDEPLANVPLVLAGLGFGLALAPVNAALLAATATPCTAWPARCWWSPGWSACWSASRR